MQELSGASGSRIVTLRQVWEDYQRLRQLKPKTLKVYRNCLSLCFGDWFDRDVASISKNDIEERHVELSKHPAQANMAMRTLRALLTFAGYKYEVVANNPVRRLSELKLWNRVQRRKRYITLRSMPTWFRAVLDCPNHTTRDLHLLLMFTGLRKNEAIKLKWSDVNFSEAMVRIADTKNGDPHEFPMSTHVKELLARRLNGRKADPAYVFRGRWPGRHLSEHDAGYHLITELSGIEFTYHDLRRTFATVAREIGIEHEVIKDLLNHRSGDVTRGYFCNSIEPLRSPMQRINDEMLHRAQLDSLWR